MIARKLAPDTLHLHLQYFPHSHYPTSKGLFYNWLTHTPFLTHNTQQTGNIGYPSRPGGEPSQTPGFPPLEISAVHRAPEVPYTM
ncbi:hypothetical protein GJ744_012203 [Endocarpon pusillum]|uniref:Uncharacterized protein n=1 Tax=Endocarpon pusillum TaxID=364733 RepID=A0A8H7E0J5_9EURO|nr:hypothetical protein GJ744_012203 [Endocarpon pusillum]